MSIDFEAIAKGFSKTELPESEVELAGEIPAEALAQYQGKALAAIAKELELPGFRKGNVPPEIAQKKVGELTVLEEAVELAMRDLYPALLDAHNADAVGRPEIRITKLAPGNPAGLVVRVAVYPAVELPKNWEKTGEKIELEAVPDILDAEVDEALESIRRAHAKATGGPDSEESVSAAAGQQGDASKLDSPEPAVEAASVAEQHPHPTDEVPEGKLPALDDAFAQSLGSFADLADLKQKLRDNMKQEKEQKAKEARRGKIVEVLLEKSAVAVPNIFIESELDKILSQLREDTARFGLSFEDYLKQVKKTEDEVRADFREQARKRAKLQLVLNKIAEVEKVEAEKEKVDEELKHALEHFPDARPELVRIHIETVLRNEKVLQMLEGTQQ